MPVSAGDRRLGGYGVVAVAAAMGSWTRGHARRSGCNGGLRPR